MRTLVLSDLHGDSVLLERALEHARFAAGDRLIIAGDLLDGGPDDTVGLARSLGATVLAGNHEVSAAVGLVISPQDESTRERQAELAEKFISGEWSLAMEVEGWLVTHAGVSAALEDYIVRATRSPAVLAELLNEDFIQEMRQATTHSDSFSWSAMERYRLAMGALGPLWFRPDELSMLPRGLKQIVGHTPPEHFSPRHVDALESHGWLLVDAGGHGLGRSEFRYAEIADGEARVVSAAG